jgi:hypothetical protein
MNELTTKMAKTAIPSKTMVVKTPGMDLDHISEFVTYLPPPVNERTRIIAVCGCVDFDTSYEVFDFDKPYVPGEAPDMRSSGNSDPVLDGWFISDFYAFMHLLQNSGAAAETWITTEEPQHLVTRYNQYLHGNPYYPRKVVLSQGLLNQGFAQQNLMVVNADELKQRFIHHLEQEVDQAQRNNQKILLLMFGHGNEETKGVYLYKEQFLVKEFRAIVGEKVEATIISTACFSGGWSVRRDIDKTTFAAAGEKNESLSWTSSTSVGRYCGGIYTSALIKAWQNEAERAEKTSDTLPPKPEQERTQKEFASGVFQTLTEIDRKWKKHEIRFSVENDMWGSGWSQMSTLPMISFQQRWDSLEEVLPTADPTSWLNRDPAAASVFTSSQSSASSDSDLSDLFYRTGSMPAAWTMLKRQAQQYLDSHPGSDESANNKIHGFLRRLLEGRAPRTEKNLRAVGEVLAFRMGLSAIATEMVQVAGMGLPSGKVCSKFSVGAWERLCEKNPNHRISKAYTLATDLIFSNVLPDPVAREQGERWNKPHRYIAAAIAANPDFNISPEQVQTAVRLLEATHQNHLVMAKSHLEEEKSVRGRKRSWFESVGKKMRDLSPKKR